MVKYVVVHAVFARARHLLRGVRLRRVRNDGAYLSETYVIKACDGMTRPVMGRWCCLALLSCVIELYSGQDCVQARVRVAVGVSRCGQAVGAVGYRVKDCTN